VADEDHDLRVVRILELPVPLHVRASEHGDELMREFAYLRAQAEDPEAPSVPSQLLDLVDDLTSRFSGFTAATRAELDAAIAEHRPSVDLEYRVPVEAGPACVDLDRLLDEADEFCRRGEHLLTLEAPPEVVAYRHWYLEEFSRQISGAEPRAWTAR
jgi:hypothetical protein